MTTSDAPLLSLVYASTATEPFDAAALAALLETSRRNNAADGLTGLLLHRDGRFLQVLEGPADAVHARMAVIADDPRHSAVRVLLEEATEARWFPEWTMGYGRDDDAAAIPGYRATFDDLDDGDEDGPTTIRALRELIGWFRERAAV